MSLQFHDKNLLLSLDRRSREVFKTLVDEYLESGLPVGSIALVDRLEKKLSPATVRHTMAKLQDMGLLYAPHVSAGRLPTKSGLRLFVSGLLEWGRLPAGERSTIEESLDGGEGQLKEIFDKASRVLSDLAGCACLVAAPADSTSVRYVEFVHVDTEQILVVLVRENGLVENRLMQAPPGLTQNALVEAGNYLNARLAGRSLVEVSQSIIGELEEQQAQMDALSARVAKAGLASWSGGNKDYLVVHGSFHLVDNIEVFQDIEKISMLLRSLESGRISLDLLRLTEDAQGVQIFIGSQTFLSTLSDCSVIAAPLHQKEKHIVGAIGVIGPARTNYARIVPMVDYTAHVINRLLVQRQEDREKS